MRTPSVLSLVFASLLCSLSLVGGELSFEGPLKVTEDYVLGSCVSPAADSLSLFPPGDSGLSCRYVEFGRFMGGQDLIVVNDKLSPLETKALEYLKKVKSWEDHDCTQGLGRLSSFITEKKKTEITEEILRLKEILQSHDRVHFVATKQEGDVGVSLFIAQQKGSLFSLKSSFIALIKEGDEWVPCAMPASFANANIAYEGEVRRHSEALATWSKENLVQQVERAEKQVQADVEKRLLALRHELKGADQAILMERFIRGLRAQDSVELASVLHLKGGAESVESEMGRRMYRAQSLLDCLSNHDNIVVPLDPKPVVLSHEEEKPKNNRRPAGQELNGEERADCALGIIMDRSRGFMRDSRAVYYVTFSFSEANGALPPAMPDSFKASSTLASASSDGIPFFGFSKKMLETGGVIANEALMMRKNLATTSRMARDFHLRYPVFQFKRAQEAAAFIITALWEKRPTELLRCLPVQNFTSGDALMKCVVELGVLDDQVGALKDPKLGYNSSGVLRRPKPLIENVVMYERGDEAVVCWKQVDEKLDQARFSSLNLRKLGDYWYLSLPSDPIPSSALGLRKIEKKLRVCYTFHQLRDRYQEVPVLKKMEKLEHVGKAVHGVNLIERLVKESNINELIKHCLVLEDTPESRMRMEGAIIEYVQDYGHQMQRARMSRRGVEEDAWFMTERVQLVEYSPRPNTRGRVLLEAPLLFFAKQGESMYWVPELTLLGEVYPKRKKVSDQRLALAKKFLSAHEYRIYEATYKMHNKQTAADIEKKSYLVDPERK